MTDRDAERQDGNKRTQSVPDPEVDAKPRRRRFSAEYKLEIIKEVDACSSEGEVGAILRREGLYSSHPKTWRDQVDMGALRELGRRRGPRSKRQDKEVERAVLCASPTWHFVYVTSNMECQLARTHCSADDLSEPIVTLLVS